MLSKTEKSHESLVRTKKSIETLTDGDINQLFQNLRTRHNNELSDNYKISVLRTIKKINANITKRPKQLNLKALRSTALNVDIKKVVIDIIKTAYTLSSTMIGNMTTRSLIDSYISILLVTACFTNIKDMFNLTESDLNSLVINQSVIKGKKITINKLFLQAEPLIRELITQRKTIDTDVEYNNTILISCSPNIINKTVKSLCEESATTFELDLNQFKSIGISKFKFKQPTILYKFLIVNS